MASARLVSHWRWREILTFALRSASHGLWMVLNRYSPFNVGPISVLLETAGDDRLGALYVLAVHTGMRLGELLGLRWEDIDLERGRLQLRRGLTTPGNRLVFGELKTKRSRRTIQLTAGELYEDHGLVFATYTGTPISPSSFRRRSLAPLLERAGLPRIRFHDLRHTAATLLLSRSVHPKYVQELLGHATIAQTLDTYSHVIPGMDGGAASAMEEALS